MDSLFILDLNAMPIKEMKYDAWVGLVRCYVHCRGRKEKGMKGDNIHVYTPITL